MSSYAVDLILQGIDYPSSKLKINLMPSTNISDSRTQNLSVSATSRLKKLFRDLRDRAAIFADEEILEEIKRWRKEKNS